MPGPQLASLQERVGEFIGRLPGARPTDGATRHITLKFLGSTPAARLPEVEGCCGAVAAGGGPCELRIEGLGAFPRPVGATVLWAGVTDPAGMLGRLAGGLGRVFAPMGYPSEQRPFTAHVTLARFRQPARLELPEPPSLEPFQLRQIGLYRSRLSSVGPSYELLATFPLGRG